MLNRIEVAQKSSATDSPAHKILNAMREDLGLPADSASLIRAYTLEMDITAEQAEQVARDLFCDPITEIHAVNAPLASKVSADFDWLLEAGFKPGVTDNVGRSAREGVADALSASGLVLGEDDKVYTSRQVLLKGKLTREQAVRVATALLANPLIETWEVISRAEWDKNPGVKVESRKVVVPHTPSVKTIDLPENAGALQKISDEMLLALGRAYESACPWRDRCPKSLEL